MICDAKGQGFVVTALQDFEFAGGQEMQLLEEIEEAFIFFVDAKNLRGIAGVKFREQNATLLAQLRNAATDRDSVGTSLAASEALYEQGFDGR